MNPSFKTCPRCQTDAPQDAPLCPRCSYLYRSPTGEPLSPAAVEKKIPLLWILAIVFLMVAMVVGTLLFAASDKYPFLGTWIESPLQDHPAAEIRFGKEGIAETNFRYQDNLELLFQPERTRRYRWTNAKNTITFLTTTVAEKTGFRTEWKVNADGSVLTLTGIDSIGRQGIPLTLHRPDNRTEGK